MTRKEIKQICQIYDGLRAERDAATIAYNSEDTFWEHVLAIYKLSQPSLPSNLDEAAENYYENDCPYDGEARVVNREHDVWFPSQAIEDAFKAGAEWMARQGETVEGEVVATSTDGWESVRLYKKLHSVDDKVIVQIRKK